MRSHFGQAIAGRQAKIAGVDAAAPIRCYPRKRLARQPFAGVASDWSSGINPGDFGLPASYGLAKMAAHVYTDRPIYRPGQTVNFKGVLRAEDDVKFSLPANPGTVQVTIRSTSG